MWRCDHTIPYGVVVNTTIVRNRHTREVAAPPAAISDVLATTGQPGCLVSPTGWPPDMRIRLDGPVVPGSAGGHGGIGYSVESVERGHHLVFRMSPDDSLRGVHRFDLEPLGDGTRVAHRLEGSVAGIARVWWPIVRRFHDAYIEAVFDNIEQAATGTVRRTSRPPRWMRAWNRIDAARQRWTPSRRLTQVAAVTVPAVVAGIGVVHLNWAGGGHWPASSRRDLAEAVIGWSTMPPDWSSGVVGIGLVGGAAGLAATALGGRRLAPGVAGLMTAGLLARGTVFWVIDGLGAPGRYRTLSLALYTPLTLALGIGAAAIVRSSRPQQPAQHPDQQRSLT